jgi:hypothetical protein
MGADELNFVGTRGSGSVAAYGRNGLHVCEGIKFHTPEGKLPLRMYSINSRGGYGSCFIEVPPSPQVLMEFSSMLCEYAVEIGKKERQWALFMYRIRKLMNSSELLTAAVALKAYWTRKYGSAKKIEDIDEDLTKFRGVNLVDRDEILVLITKLERASLEMRDREEEKKEGKRKK